MNGKVSVKNISWEHVVAPIVVAILVGIGSSYVTTKVQISTLRARVSQTEQDIARLRSKAAESSKEDLHMRERIIRMETKIDLLLKSQGIDTSKLSESPKN